MRLLSNKAPINPNVLKWARENSAININKAAKIASTDIEEYKKWELGEDFPSISKLRKLANLFKRPLPTFFLPQVPKEIPFPTDFRTFSFESEKELSPESRFALRKAFWFQSIAKELMGNLGYQIMSLRETISIKDNINDTINIIRKLDIEKQFSWDTNWAALKNWRDYLENEGIFVFQISMPLSEIRGFSLIRDDYPPAIIINSKDTPNGRIFTLFHEYSHILLIHSGICLPQEIESRSTTTNVTEKYCNDFAGTFLVPTDHLNRLISEFYYSDIFHLLDVLSAKFKVSKFVILNRLYSIRKINFEEYKNIYENLANMVTKPRSSGGDFYKNRVAERGRHLVRLTIEAESGEVITKARALEILGIKLKHYEHFTSMIYES